MDIYVIQERNFNKDQTYAKQIITVLLELQLNAQQAHLEHQKVCL